MEEIKLNVENITQKLRVDNKGCFSVGIPRWIIDKYDLKKKDKLRLGVHILDK